MRNKAVDLNNLLFEQMERLNDEDLSKDALEKESKRARAMVSVASAIIENAHLGLQAEKIKMEYGYNDDIDMPTLLENKNGKKIID